MADKPLVTGHCPLCGIPQEGNDLCAQCQNLQDELKKT